jgi:hypothetical protein
LSEPSKHAVVGVGKAGNAPALGRTVAAAASFFGCRCIGCLAVRVVALRGGAELGRRGSRGTLPPLLLRLLPPLLTMLPILLFLLASAPLSPRLSFAVLALSWPPPMIVVTTAPLKKADGVKGPSVGVGAGRPTARRCTAAVTSLAPR